MSRKGENIFRRKDGRWEARYIHHRDAEGKAVYAFIYARTYAEAREKKLAAQSSPECIGAQRNVTCDTLEALACKWLADVRMSVKESTYARYHRTATKYLVPMLGKLELIKIDTGVINTFSEKLLKQGGKRGGALSPKTVTDILVTLKIILKYGVSSGIISSVPEGLRYPSKEKRNISLVDESRLEKFEEAIRNSHNPIALGTLIALFTGLRLGELCGLRWCDVDFESAVMRVQRTVERIADLDPATKRRTKVIVCEPKTQSSDRFIPLSRMMLEVLSKHYAMQRGATRNQLTGECYILNGENKPYEPHSFYVAYKKWQRENDLGDFTFHALRHTFATRCVAAGFDTKSLSEILGHSSISTTLSIYVHPSMSQKREQMEKLCSNCLLC